MLRNWGRWGDDDERGALNLLTSEAVLRGIASVRHGRIYELGLPVDASSAPILNGRGEPRRLTLTCDSDDTMYRDFGAAEGVGANQDVLMLASHHGTHLDALSHVFAGHTMYNGFESSTFKSFSGAARLGVEKLGGFAGRAVVLDIAKQHGVDCLPGGYVISGSELDRCASTAGITVTPGDILLVRTGWIDRWRAGGEGETEVGQPGIGLDAVEYIGDHDIAAVGSDNSAIEVIPFDSGTFLAVHIELLVNLGVPLIEHLDLSALARDDVTACLFCVAPLRFVGAGGSPVNPIAIA